MNRRLFVTGLVATLVAGSVDASAGRKNKKSHRDNKPMNDKIRARLSRKMNKAFAALEANQGSQCHWFVAANGADYTPFPDDDMSGIAICDNGARFDYAPDTGFTVWNDCYRDQGNGYTLVTDWSLCFPGN